MKLPMSRKDARLLDLRQGEEDAATQRESAAAGMFKEGPPPIPQAQLVYSPTGVIGVAVENARFVCPLPKEYAAHCELAVIDRGRLIVTHPNLPPLLVDPQQGTTRPF